VGESTACSFAILSVNVVSCSLLPFACEPHDKPENARIAAAKDGRVCVIVMTSVPFVISSPTVTGSAAITFQSYYLEP
jgi:hypothetical protein